MAVDQWSNGYWTWASQHNKVRLLHSNKPDWYYYQTSSVWQSEWIPMRCDHPIGMLPKGVKLYPLEPKGGGMCGPKNTSRAICLRNGFWDLISDCIWIRLARVSLTTDSLSNILYYCGAFGPSSAAVTGHNPGFQPATLANRRNVTLLCCNKL